MCGSTPCREKWLFPVILWETETTRRDQRPEGESVQCFTDICNCHTEPRSDFMGFSQYIPRGTTVFRCLRMEDDLELQIQLLFRRRFEHVISACSSPVQTDGLGWTWQTGFHCRTDEPKLQWEHMPVQISNVNFKSDIHLRSSETEGNDGNGECFVMVGCDADLCLKGVIFI